MNDVFNTEMIKLLSDTDFKFIKREELLNYKDYPIYDFLSFRWVLVKKIIKNPYNQVIIITGEGPTDFYLFEEKRFIDVIKCYTEIIKEKNRKLKYIPKSYDIVNGVTSIKALL